LLLLYHLREWKSSHDNTYPSTFADKTKFRELVRSAARINNPEGGEENYDEACAAVLKTITPPPVGGGCMEMFALDSCTNLSATSSNFWIIANAIKQFYDLHAVLPLPGSMPDMKATSEEYIRLQNIYKSKARSDAAEVKQIVQQTVSKLSRTTPIDDSEIEAFCKNASHVRVLTNPEKTPLPALRLQQADSKTIANLPSVIENDWEGLFPGFLALNTSKPQSLDISMLSSDPETQENISKAITEVQRVQGGEMHNISSALGGMVAQEAIKLLTRQYVPVDGTCVYDGIKSKCGVFKV
jgi:amyloid beta precursor protein binding protein 1